MYTRSFWVLTLFLISTYSCTKDEDILDVEPYPFETVFEYKIDGIAQETFTNTVKVIGDEIILKLDEKDGISDLVMRINRHLSKNDTGSTYSPDPVYAFCNVIIEGFSYVSQAGQYQIIYNNKQDDRLRIEFEFEALKNLTVNDKIHITDGTFEFEY